MYFFGNDEENNFFEENQFDGDELIFSRPHNTYTNYNEVPSPNNAFIWQSLSNYHRDPDAIINEYIKENVFSSPIKREEENEEEIKSNQCNIQNNKVQEVIENIEKSCKFQSSIQTSNQSTDDKTKLGKNIPKERNIEEIIKKFKGKVQIRTDYLKKKYKVFLSRFAKSFLNSLLKKFDLENSFGTFSLPNSKDFTGNVTDTVNYKFLQITVREMFTIGKDRISGGSLQVKNNKLIEKIFDSSSKKVKGLKDFLNLTVENMITLFEDSKKFNEFINDEQVIFLDYYFQKEKGEEYSFRKKGGFVKVIKLCRM